MATALNIQIHPFGTNDPYNSLKKTPIIGLDGNRLGQVNLTLPSVIQESVQTNTISKLLGAIREIGLKEMLRRLSLAGDSFLKDDLEIGGISFSPEEYCKLQSNITGLPVHLCKANMHKIANAMKNAEGILRGHLEAWCPELSLEDLFEGKTGKGHALQAEFFAAILPSNSPGVHQVWTPLLALLPALLKPGSEELLSPLRIRAACQKAEMTSQAIAYFPGAGSSLTETIVQRSNRTILFGSGVTAAPYIGDSRIDLHAAGYTKIMIGNDKAPEWEKFLDVVEESTVANAGKGCIGCSAVYLDNPYALKMAQALEARFRKIGELPLADPHSKLSYFTSKGAARKTLEAIKEHCEKGDGRIMYEGNLDDLIIERENCSMLLPIVAYFEDPQPGEGDPAKWEYPGPVLAVVNSSGKHIPKIIDHTLILTAITENADVLRELEMRREFGQISKLNRGPIPTTQLHATPPGPTDKQAPFEGEGLVSFMFKGVQPPALAHASFTARRRENITVSPVARPTVLPQHELAGAEEMESANQRRDQHVREMMQIHFGDGGSPYWSEQKENLDFNPLTDVQGFDDLVSLFGNFDEKVLKTGYVEHLVPTYLRGNFIETYQTGGSSGGFPSRRPSFRDHFIDYEEFSATLDDAHFPKGAAGRWLMAGPSGPRRLPDAIRHLARHRGNEFCTSIDFDPGISKKLELAGNIRGMRLAAEHVVGQAVRELSTGQYTCLFTPPPVLREIVDRVDIASLGIKGVFFGGTEIEPEYLRSIAERIGTSEVQLRPTYGNTLMGLGIGIIDPNYSVGYFPAQPRTMMRLVDIKNLKSVVDYGEFGRVEGTLLTRELFIPKLLERDEAKRVRPCKAYPWDGVAEVREAGSFGKKVTAGLY